MGTANNPARFKLDDRPLNCPSCGAPLPRRLRHAKIAVCESCRSIVYLEGAEATFLGSQSALVDYPSLLELDCTYRYDKLLFEPVGMLRYSYGRGFWEEWWCVGDDGGGHWISVDEGDFAMEEPLGTRTGLPSFDDIRRQGSAELLGEAWTLTEVGEASLAGIAGQLPEVIDPRRQFFYLHLSQPGAKLLTLEYDDPQGAPELHLGQWIDPFRIEKV
jgi:hypothetical protein